MTTKKYAPLFSAVAGALTSGAVYGAMANTDSWVVLATIGIALTAAVAAIVDYTARHRRRP